MKRFLIYSLALHIVFLLLVFSLGYERKKEEERPFSAWVVTLEELGEEVEEMPPPELSIMPQEEKDYRMPELPDDMPPPKEISQIPTPPAIGIYPQEAATDEEIADKNNGVFHGDEFKKSLTPEPSDMLPKDDIDIGDGREGFMTVIDERDTEESRLPKSLREKLFDRDILRHLAKKEMDNANPDSAITFDTEIFRYYGFLQRLRKRIEDAWRYPQYAAKRGIYGDLYILFTIKKDGQLGNVELIRTSGHKSLDEAAIKALKNAAPFWPLPDAWGRDSFTIKGHFIYLLRGMHIR